MELILRWDACVVIMKDIIYKCYRVQVSGRVGHASFPGRPTLTVCDNVNDQAGQSRRLKTRIIRSHGIKKGQIMSLE